MDVKVIKKGKSFFTKAVGVSHKNPDGSDRQQIIAQHCEAGRPVALLPEPDNPVDPDAIAIWIAVISEQNRFLRAPLITTRQYQIGYLTNDLAMQVATYRAGGGEITATIANRTGGRSKTYGINLEIRPN